MTRLKQAWLALCVVALAGCDLPQVVLVCHANGAASYRSAPAPKWTFIKGSWYAPSSGAEYRQSAFESCGTVPYAKGNRQ
jgi:hypothetical protein